MAGDEKTSGKPYDISLKNLLSIKPDEWSALFDLPGNTLITELDTDISGVTLVADRLYRVETEDAAYGLHVELESGHTGSELPRRLHEYSVLAQMRHKLLFRSVAVLLTKGANSPQITGLYEQRLPDGTLVDTFHYDVVRVYNIPTEELLSAGLSVVPLAPLGAFKVKPEAELPYIIERMAARFKSEATDEDELRKLWGASWLLVSTRHSPELAERLVRGAMKSMLTMEDLPLYSYLTKKGQAKGLAEGQAKGVRQTVLTLGATRYGEPSGEVRATLESSDYDRLQQIAARLFAAQSWDELLAPGA
ncbi:MAG: hypothetical protein H7Y38_06760 [Armatimonadetes bacterium]|nr:hypothetical protein [Armatimonadota bacterium]